MREVPEVLCLDEWLDEGVDDVGCIYKQMLKDSRWPKMAISDGYFVCVVCGLI